jgi:probable HAF family extracellular repeat protein
MRLASLRHAAALGGAPLDQDAPMKSSLCSTLVLGLAIVACDELSDVESGGTNNSDFEPTPHYEAGAPARGEEGVGGGAALPGGASDAEGGAGEASSTGGAGEPSSTSSTGGTGEASSTGGAGGECGGAGGAPSEDVAPVFPESCAAAEPPDAVDPECAELPYHAVIIDSTRPLGALMRNEGIAINNAGMVAGTYNPGSDLEEWAPWLWESGSTTTLSHPRAAFGHGHALNESGTMLATFRIDGGHRYFLYQSDTLDEVEDLSPNNLNDRGDLVGSFKGAAAVRVNGEVLTLGIAGYSQGYAISNRREVAGAVRVNALLNTHAFLFRCGKLHDLGTLGGSSSVALDLNERGQVVGTSRDAEGIEQVFLSEDGVMKALFRYNAAANVAINERGEVVNGEHLASNGRVYQLKELVAHQSCWTMLWAHDINDHGDIVGWGRACSTNPAEPIDFAPAVVVTQYPERYRRP